MAKSSLIGGPLARMCIRELTHDAHITKQPNGPLVPLEMVAYSDVPEHPLKYY
ncbi:hypothetical protein D3C83_202400 [compost metagenome]